MNESVSTIIEKALAAGQTTLSEFESKKILAAYGIPVAGEILADNWEEVKQAAEEIGYPVVLKKCAPMLAHKTEQGLLIVGIKDDVELRRAFEELAVKSQGQFLVQEMVNGSRELVLGLMRDAQFGPCVMFGLGGIFTEVLNDVSFRLAPLSEADAFEMTHEIRAQKLLEAVRGDVPVDMAALTAGLQDLGRLGLDYPAIREIDINPLIVRDGCPVAVDALVTLEKPPSPSSTDTAIPTVGLERFFAPRNVAVIGASGTSHKPGNDVIRNILANNFKGELFLVNPKGGEILGHHVYSSIRDLPGDIDLAIIVLPAKANPQAIRECAAKGIKALVLAAGGFAEVDENGYSLQEELVTIIRETGVRVIGPNTSGHTSTPAQFTSSFFPLGALPSGNISYIAQTGNFATHTMRYIATAESFGVARVMGLGNKVDVEESEVLAYYGDDPETKAVFVYLESFKRPRLFLEIAAGITRKKPIILLKGGSTVEGAKTAVAHTAAMASDDRIMDGALKQAGIVRVHRYSDLFQVAKAISHVSLPRGNRVGFLGPSGAMLVTLTDLCLKRLNLEVPEVEDSTRQRLQKISPPIIRMRNPVDIWAAATVHGAEFAYKEGMEALLQDPNIDAVVCILMLVEEMGVPELKFIPDLASDHPEKPILLTFSGEKQQIDEAKHYLEPLGIPTYPYIEQPFEVLNTLALCRKAMDRPF